MGLVARFLNQVAVYWPKGTGSSLDSYGNPVYGIPVEIRCRWEDVQEDFIDSMDIRQVSRSKVYVEEDLDIGGVLMLGEYDTSLDSVPKNNPNAWEIRAFNKIPNIRNTEIIRVAFL